MLFADILQTPTNADFAVFAGCMVALLLCIALVLTIVSQVKSLFFAKTLNIGERPVTDGEFENRIARMEGDMNAKIVQLKTDLLTEIGRPNLNYVTQTQLEAKLDKLETSLNRKIDEGGVYAHQREHAFNNTLQTVQLKLAEISIKMGELPVNRRGPRDATKGEES